MPVGKNVHVIFEQFVHSLSALIKEKVAEAVSAATSDCLAEKFGVGAATTAAEAPKPARRRRRRRGRKPAVAEVVKPVKRTRKYRKRRASKGPKPVTLSKTGKRIGRPPKAVVEVKPAE